MSRTGGLGSPRGRAFWPVRGPTLHRYGEQLQGELRWKGMVIGASEGTEVKAIADGRVILADWLQGYGPVVVVEHGKGDMSLYGYNQSALVSVGTQVRAGQPIALVGSSGGRGRPALYFEIRRQGSGGQSTAVVGKISFATTISSSTTLSRQSAGLRNTCFAGKLAIVIDDFGYRPHTENRYWRCLLPSPLPFCLTPHMRVKWQSKRITAGMKS